MRRLVVAAILALCFGCVSPQPQPQPKPKPATFYPGGWPPCPRCDSMMIKDRAKGTNIFTVYCPTCQECYYDPRTPVVIVRDY